MRPRVALVVTTTTAERGDVLAKRLRGLLDTGWDARLFCKGESWASDPALRDPALGPRVEFSPARDRYPPPLLHRRPAELLRYLRARGEAGPFDRRLLELRPDLIHFHSGSAAWKGMRLKNILDCRVVVSFREDGADLDVPDPALLWEADLLLFPDEDGVERAAARGCPRERAEVLPPPLTLDPRLDGPRPQAGPLRVLSAGPLTWAHGFEHSVHAVRLVLDMGIACEYRIVGRGDHLLAVAFARHQLDLAQHVELVSPDGGNPLMEELRTADVLVDPAVTDTISPTPLIAAQALGIPFVATRRDGLPEDAGIAVPRRNPRAIADGLAILAGDPAVRERMARAGRAGIGRYPTLEEHLLRLEDLYGSVLA
ncbi:MAG: glycosyltransferase family 4 protein [Solirubrobacterales bacterium]